MKREQKRFKFISSARPKLMYTSHAPNVREPVYGLSVFSTVIYIHIRNCDICMRFHIPVNIFMFIRVGRWSYIEK